MYNIPDLQYEQIVVGTSAEFEQEISSELVDAFAAVSGDYNSLHVDGAYAATTQFGQRIAHGMIGAALFSRLVGMQLPGLRSLYLSQSLFFRQPMYIGMRVRVSGVVIQQVAVAHALKISLKINNVATGELLIDGEALVKVL